MSYKQLSESVVSAKCDCCSVEEAMYSIVNSATRVVFAHGTLWVGQERGHGGIDCYSLPVSGCRHCLSCKTYYRSLGSKMCVPQINYYSVARSCADEMAVNVEHGPDTGFCFSSISLSPTFERVFYGDFLVSGIFRNCVNPGESIRFQAWHPDLSRVTPGSRRCDVRGRCWPRMWMSCPWHCIGCRIIKS